jgi:glycosyltransferase involved in cell wall biosynthesis
MKILSFSYCFPSSVQPTWGMFVKQRLAAMAKRMELQVVSPVPFFPLLSRLRNLPKEGREIFDDLTVYRPRFFYFPGVLKSWDGRFYARGLKRWLRDFVATWQPDLLDAHFIWPDGVGVSLLARSLGLPYVITLRGKIYPCLEVPSQYQQCADALQNASAVISVSHDMAEIAQQLGAPKDRVFVIPNGVDTKFFQPQDKAECREKLGLEKKGRWLVTVAHLGPRKGHWETVRALSRLPEDVRLVLVGGDQTGGKDEQALRHFVDEQNLSDRVIIAGPQPYEKIPLYFSAADASVLASYREGCPNVVLESLACGTPVVASNVGAVPDLLTVPENGRIVPPRDPDSLAAALQEVLDTQWPAETISRSSAVKSWDMVAEEVQGVFKRVLNEQKNRNSIRK